MCHGACNKCGWGGCTWHDASGVTENLCLLLLQLPRTGAYIMVRLAPYSRCNLTDPADIAAGAAPGASAAAGAYVDASGAAAAAASDSSRVCVASMMAQEGEQPVAPYILSAAAAAVAVRAARSIVRQPQLHVEEQEQATISTCVHATAMHDSRSACNQQLLSLSGYCCLLCAVLYAVCLCSRPS